VMSGFSSETTYYSVAMDVILASLDGAQTSSTSSSSGCRQHRSSHWHMRDNDQAGLYIQFPAAC
jgi:hypothetical protein